VIMKGIHASGSTRENTSPDTIQQSMIYISLNNHMLCKYERNESFFTIIIYRHGSGKKSESNHSIGKNRSIKILVESKGSN
jgi:hypothetical protein